MLDKNGKIKIAHWKKIEMSIFSISDFILQTFAISKQIKLRFPATSHLEDFLQSFQMVMDFLWFRSIVTPKLAKQSVRFFSFP